MALPERWATSVLPRQKLRNYYSFLLEHNKTEEVLTGFTEWVLFDEGKTYAPGICILVAGVTRIGKSRVAREIARQLGYRHLTMDDIRTFYKGLASPQRRAFVKVSLIRSISAKRPYGLVLEGDELILKNESPKKLYYDPTEVSLDLIRGLGRETSNFSIVLLSSFQSANQRLRAIKTHAEQNGCWTSRLSERELEGFASGVQVLEDHLRSEIKTAKIDYIEFDGTSDESVARVAALIVKKVNSKTSKS